MKEKIKLETFIEQAKAVEDMNEELSDLLNDEGRAWSLKVYFIDEHMAHCWDKEEFPYDFVDTYEEYNDEAYETTYYGIWQRRSDNKYFRIWSDYDTCCDELTEVTRTLEEVTKYE